MKNRKENRALIRMIQDQNITESMPAMLKVTEKYTQMLMIWAIRMEKIQLVTKEAIFSAIFDAKNGRLNSIEI